MSSTSESTSFESTTSTRRYVTTSAQPVRGWWPWGLLPLLGLLLLYLYGCSITAPAMEEAIAGRVTANLDDHKSVINSVNADGQIVNISTNAGKDDLIGLRAIARGTTCDTWAGPLVCPTRVNITGLESAANTPESAAGDPVHLDFQISKTGSNVTLSGEVPDIDTHRRFVDAATGIFDSVEDNLTVTDTPTFPGYRLAIDRALAVLRFFDRGSANWTGGALNANGLIRGADEAVVNSTFNDTVNAPQLGELTVTIARDEASCNTSFEEALTTSTINFATASARISDASQPLLKQLSEIAATCPGRLRIEGHTDNTGGAEANMTLSQQRAAAVKDALVNLGVHPTRIDAAGFGETQPVASNNSSEGRARNRRIVIKVAE